MTNEVLIRVAINDDTQTGREKLKAAFAAMGAEAAVAFNTSASKGLKEAGSSAGAEVSDAFREMTMLGYGVAGADAAREFTAKSRPALKGGASGSGADASDALRAAAIAGFGTAGTDAAKEFTAQSGSVLRRESGDVAAAAAEAMRDVAKAGFGEAGEEASEEFGKKTSEGSGEPAEETGKKTSESVSRGIRARSALIATALGGAILGGGPLIDAGAIGTGALFLTAMGATIQRGNPALQAGWAKLKDDATTAAQGASIGMVAPLDRAMGEIDQLVQRESPLIKKMFDDAAADIPILTQGVEAFATNALPGLESGLANSQQVMSATAGVAGDLGQAVGETGAAFGRNSQEVSSSLHAVGAVVTEVGHAASGLIDFTTRLASGALPTLASGFNGLLSGAGAVLHVLEPIAPALGSIAVYGVEAWGSFKLADIASTGVNKLSDNLKSLSKNLGDYATKTKDTEGSSSRITGALGTAAAAGAGFASKAASLAETVAGPLGLALGLGSFALELFGQNSEEASQKAQEQAQFTQNLAQALKQSGGALDANVQSTIANQLATDNNAKTLEKYGVSISDMQQKLLAGNGAIDKTVAALQAQKDAITDNANNYAQLGETGSSILLESSQKQVDAIDDQIGAWKALETDLAGPIQQQKDMRDAINASAAALGIHTDRVSDAQRSQEAYDSTLLSAAQLYLQDTSAIKQYTDAVVSAAGANLTAQQQFQQLDDAVTSAQNAVVAAAGGVESAQHSLVDAGNAVDSARHSEQQAVIAVTEAQYQYQQSLRQEKQAQDNVMAARQAAADQMASLHRQMADQGDSLASAKLRLEQAQEAVAKAGLSGMTLDQLGDPTAANASKFQLLLELSQAQHALNDTQAQGADLAKQNAAAQKEGIEGNAGVIQAEQQLADAKHATAQAAQGVQNAQYAEKQASQAVSDAIWAQHAAQLALTQAQLNATDAQKKLTAAKDADSRNLDINTAAGNRNWQMVEDLWEKNYQAIGTVQGATTATENQTTAMGFNRDAVQHVIDTLNGLTDHTFKFSIVGTPSLDMSQVRGMLYDPTLGLFTNGQGSSGGIASAGRLAAGGPISGHGSPIGDALIAAVSPGEWVQPADAVDYYGPEFMEAIRKKQIPRFASGGPVLNSPLGLNAAAAVGWGTYETVGLTANAMGRQPPLNTKMPPPGSFSAGSFGGLAGLGAVQGRAASGGVAKAAQQYAAAQLGLYGWGAEQMGPLIALWNQESGWNPWAVNPSSGAYGIPQSLGHGHPYDLGDYVAQINWGLNYIKGRYGSPAAAEGHERAFNWYAAGGPVSGGMAGVNDGGLELIRLPSGSTVVPHSGLDKGLRDAVRGADGGNVEVTFAFAGDTDTVFASAFQRLLRQGAIRISAKYVT